jgi:hypothetical protein
MIAVDHGHLEMIEWILDYGRPDVHATDSHGHNVLARAALSYYWRSIAAIKLVVAKSQLTLEDPMGDADTERLHLRLPMLRGTKLLYPASTTVKSYLLRDGPDLETLQWIAPGLSTDELGMVFITLAMHDKLDLVKWLVTT